MKPWLSIDLGTTNSAVAYYGPRGPEVIKVDGRELVPSVVMAVPNENAAEGEDKWQIVVGQKAVRAREKSPRSPYCYTSFKRNFGAVFNPEEATDEQMVAGEFGALHYQGPDGVTYAPEVLAAYVLDKLCSAAEAKLQTEITSAVICVPATYNIAQRNAIKKAAELVGLTEVELLDEPVAAAIAHGYQIDDDKAHRILVVDIGGGTTDVAAFEIGKGLFKVLGTNGAALVGGDDWDRHLRSYVLNLHQVEHENSTLATQQDALRLLLTEAEDVKRRLSDDDVAEFRVEDITIDKQSGADVHVITRISRDHMDEVTTALLNDIDDAMARTMAEAKTKDPKFTIHDLDAVILVGGQTRVKAIQRRVAAFAQKNPRSDVDAELAVVLGGAVQAGIREGRLASITIKNITSHSYSIETHDKPEDVATEIVRKGTAYGTKATWWLSNRDRDQTLMTLRLLQGDSKDPAKNLMVWEHQIEIDPGEPREADIQLDIEISATGEPILEVAGVVYGRAI